MLSRFRQRLSLSQRRGYGHGLRSAAGTAPPLRPTGTEHPGSTTDNDAKPLPRGHGLHGIAIASPIAFLGMHHWLQSFAYRITISWWIFLLAGLITLTISLLTISLRVIRAAIVNPTENLRSE